MEPCIWVRFFRGFKALNHGQNQRVQAPGIGLQERKGKPFQLEEKNKLCLNHPSTSSGWPIKWKNNYKLTEKKSLSGLRKRTSLINSPFERLWGNSFDAESPTSIQLPYDLLLLHFAETLSKQNSWSRWACRNALRQALADRLDDGWPFRWQELMDDGWWTYENHRS